MHFISTVLRSVTWRAVAVTQTLGLLFALTPWLEFLGHRPPGYLPFQLVQQGVSALCIMLAALAADEAVRRGWRVWRAFVVSLLCASAVTALAQWGLNTWLHLPDPWHSTQRLLFTFFGVGATWGTALMVYLNRQSARRILAGVRAGELARLRSEQRLLAARLAATQIQVDPADVLRQLAEVRGLYDREEPAADNALERLITRLRASAARALAASAGDLPP